MKTTLSAVAALFLVNCASAPAPAHLPRSHELRSDSAAVDAALRRTGTAQPGNVYKYTFPRADLDVRIAGLRLEPAFALGSWAAFLDTGDGHAMVTGDLVLTENEINDVISALQAGGIEQSALHNHLIGESPRIMYLHFTGHGDAVALARTLRTALDRTSTPPQASSASSPLPDLPRSELDRVLGLTGRANGRILQYSVPRRERIVENGMEIPPAAGMASVINFQPTGHGRAAITGDFVMVAGEVNRVLRVLQNGGIDITALHSHMLSEQPRLFFMHFWANDDAVKLAMTLRRALDQLAPVRGRDGR